MKQKYLISLETRQVENGNLANSRLTWRLDKSMPIKSNLRMPAAVFFDLDDTLIDRTAAFDRYALWIGHEHGSEVEKRVREADIADLDYGHAVADTAPSIGSSPHECWQHLWTNLPRFIDPQPQIRQMLINLGREVPLGLISNGGSEVQRAKLESADLAGLFDAVIISGDVGLEKPAPGIFAHALTQLDVAAADAWMVGDDPVADVGGAITSDMVSCWVSHDRAWPGGTRPDHVVTDVVEVIDILALVT